MEELSTTVTDENTTQQETHEDTTAETTDSGTPPEEVTATAEGSEQNEQTANEPPEFSLPITYNHENRNLTREEAVKYAQIGLNFEEGGIKAEIVKPLLRKLDYLAAQSDTTVESLVDEMMNTAENRYREELIDKFGEDETVIEDLMRVYHEKQKAKYDKVLADRKTAQQTQAENDRTRLETRLADEFIALKKEFPTLTEFTALPEEVKRAAAGGKSLAESYFRYLHTENAKIEANKTSAQNAAETSTGSLGANKGDSQTDEESRYLRALWGR